MNSPGSENIPSKPDKSGLLSGMGGSQKYIGIGLQAGGSVVVYLLLGLLVDKWLNTFPWFMLVGIFIGIAGMFALFLKMANELSDSGKKQSKRK